MTGTLFGWWRLDEQGDQHSESLAHPEQQGIARFWHCHQRASHDGWRVHGDRFD
jgi:hypothetical protein